jgi:hypothetical protein
MRLHFSHSTTQGGDAMSRRRSKPKDPILDDPSEQLQITITEITRRIDAISESCGQKAHEYCSRQKAIVDMLWQYSQLLMSKQVERAARVLQSIGDELTDLTAFAVDSFAASDMMPRSESAQPSQAEGEPSLESTELYDHTAASLSIAIEEGVQLYPELVKTRDAFVRFRRSVRNAATLWSLDDNSEELTEHLEWLGNSEKGFNVLASRHLISQAANGAGIFTDAYVQEAKARLDAIDKLILQAKTEHRAAQEQAHEMLTRQPRFEEQLTKLQGVRDTIATLPAKLVSSIVEQSGLLNAEELATWQAHEARPDFRNLSRVKVDISDWAEGIRRLLESPPKLNEQAAALLDTARRYLEQLQPADEENVSDSTATEVAKPLSTTPSSLPINPTRTGEIYQLVIAVAAYRYCSHHNYVGMSASSAFSILVILGKISEEEVELYQEPVMDQVKSRSLIVRDRSKLVTIWRKTDPKDWDWVCFRPTNKANWRWRLVERAKKPGQWQAEQLGLSEQAVTAAYERHKELQHERHTQRQKP